MNQKDIHKAGVGIPGVPYTPKEKESSIGPAEFWNDKAGTYSNTVVSETGWAQSATAGTAKTISRGDHTHGTPAAPMTNYFGNMHAYSLGSGFTVTVSVVDTFYLVSNAAITGGTSSGFTFQNNQELKCLNAGVYLVVWSMSVEAGANNQEVEGAVSINTTVQTGTAAHTEIINLAKPATIAGSGVVTLSQNDLIRLYVANHTGANNVVVDHVTLTITRVQ